MRSRDVLLVRRVSHVQTLTPNIRREMALLTALLAFTEITGAVGGHGFSSLTLSTEKRGMAVAFVFLKKTHARLVTLAAPRWARGIWTCDHVFDCTVT